MFSFEKYNQLSKQYQQIEFGLSDVFLRIDCIAKPLNNTALVTLEVIEHQYDYIFDFVFNNKMRVKGWKDIWKCFENILLQCAAKKQYIEKVRSAPRAPK